MARVAVTLVRNGAVSIKQHPSPWFSNDWLISWDDSAIARSLGCKSDAGSKHDAVESAAKEAMRAEERATAWLALKAQMSNEGWADEDRADSPDDQSKWTLREGEVAVARGEHKRDAEEMECGEDEGERDSKKAKTA